jgi:hypothetical protein
VFVILRFTMPYLYNKRLAPSAGLVARKKKVVRVGVMSDFTIETDNLSRYHVRRGEEVACIINLQYLCDEIIHTNKK